MVGQEFTLRFQTIAGSGDLVELSAEFIWTLPDSFSRQQHTLDGGRLDLGIPQASPAAGEVCFPFADSCVSVPVKSLADFLARMGKILRELNVFDPRRDVHLAFENAPWQACRRGRFLELTPALPAEHTFAGEEDWLTDSGLQLLLQYLTSDNIEKDRAAIIPANPLLQALESGMLPWEERRWARLGEGETARLLKGGTGCVETVTDWLKYLILFWIHLRERPGVRLISDRLVVDFSPRLSFISCSRSRFPASESIEAAKFFETTQRQHFDGKGFVFFKDLIVGRRHHRLGFRILEAHSLRIWVDPPPIVDEPAQEEAFANEPADYHRRNSRDCLQLVCV